MGRRPWMLRPNGDLLAAWARLVAARGAASVSLTWVKAHLTPEEALQRGLPEAMRAGNARADDLAGAARERGYPEHLLLYIQDAASRYDKYARLVELVQAMMLSILSHAETLRDQYFRRGHS